MSPHTILKGRKKIMVRAKGCGYAEPDPEFLKKLVPDQNPLAQKDAL
jgi:hypothetical protein